MPWRIVGELIFSIPFLTLSLDWGEWSLTSGWVCRLQLLLDLASSVILGSESRGTHDRVLLSQIQDSPNLEARSQYLYPQEQSGPVIPPGTGFPFRRLLRFAGLRWRYSIPAPHGRSELQSHLPKRRIGLSSGILHHVLWYRVNNVSEECIVSIFRVV
jgi:hypothetical protein